MLTPLRKALRFNARVFANGKAMSMLFVRLMLLQRFLSPFLRVELRKENISIECGVDMSDVHFVKQAGI